MSLRLPVSLPREKLRGWDSLIGTQLIQLVDHEGPLLKAPSGNILLEQHETVASGDDSNEPDVDFGNASKAPKPPRPSWNPIWLSKTSLFGFAASFALLALAVAILYAESVKHSGLVTQTYPYRYAWTYGPTAGTNRKNSTKSQGVDAV